MSNLLFDVIDLAGHTMAKVVPVTIMLAITFTVLTHFCSCNPGKPWWLKRELVTEICYSFFVPVFARVVRIGLLVLGAAVPLQASSFLAGADRSCSPLYRSPQLSHSSLSLSAAASPPPSRS